MIISMYVLSQIERGDSEPNKKHSLITSRSIPAIIIDENLLASFSTVLSFIRLKLEQGRIIEYIAVY